MNLQLNSCSGRRRRLMVVCALIAMAYWTLSAAPAEKATVVRFLLLSDADRTVRQVRDQLPASIKKGFQLSTRQLELSVEQQARLAEKSQDILHKYQKAFQLETFQPMFIAAFSDAFSQEELEGIIAFFESPAGKAYAAKMNPAMRASSAAVTQKVNEILAAMQAEIKAFAREIAGTVQAKPRIP